MKLMSDTNTLYYNTLYFWKNIQDSLAKIYD